MEIGVGLNSEAGGIVYGQTSIRTVLEPASLVVLMSLDVSA